MTEPPPGAASPPRPADRIVWLGRVTTREHVARAGAALVSPTVIWLLALLVIPSFALFALSFATRGGDGEIVWSFSLSAFERLLGFGVLGWSADYLRIFFRSVWVATVTSALSIGFGYPLAFLIAGVPKRWSRILLGLIVVPMCTNLVVRTYAWEVLLSPGLPPAKLAAWLGFVPEGRGLYPSTFAVLIGMVSTSLPFAVLPLVTNVERMDWSLVEAARDLYAGRWLVFRHAILPQTLPGLVVAVIFTFVPSMGMFVVSDRLGGSTFSLIGNQIQQQFGMSRDYPFGAALSLVMIALTLVGLWLYRRSSKGAPAA
ncbi:MAG: ABC transporter permease [Deltaproteobacteria bacterium]|nr:ABC transporter permease [Deltaproteobacteria bacterium]